VATSEKIRTIGGLIGSVLYPATAGRYGWSSRYRPVSTAAASAATAQATASHSKRCC